MNPARPAGKRIASTTLSTETDTAFDPQPIDGGWHVKTRDDGAYCIDILEMMYNYRIVLSPTSSEHRFYDHGWCYFATGRDADGNVRSRRVALLTTMAIAHQWDGYGDPPGYDKKVV